MSIFVTSALLSLLSLISYRSSLEKTRTLIFGLILLSVVITPAVGAVRELSDLGTKELFPELDNTYDSSAELYEKAFAEGIATAVCERFELRGCDVRVLIEGFSGSEWRCDKIRIILSGRASFADTAGIERFIDRLDIGECEAEIEIG